MRLQLVSCAFLACLLLSGCGDNIRDKASEISRFGAGHFDQLDRNHDGVITDKELATALDTTDFSTEEKRLIRMIRNNMSRCGHVIGTETYDYFDMIPIPDGNGGFTYMYIPNTGTRNIYGISKDDFNALPERLAK